MVAYKETAEEQLLRMIEGPQPGTPPTSMGAPDPPRSRANPWTGIRGHFSDWVRRFSPARTRPRGRDPLIWNLQLASRVLWGILAVLGAYVVVDLVLIHPSPQWGRGGAGSQGASPRESVTARVPLKPLADYIGVVVQRDPFTGLIPGMARPTAPPTARRRLEELASGYVLVGIDRGPRPAALVENTEQKRTFIVNAGDEINGMKVKKITPEGVLLSYEGEEYLLR